MNGIYYAIGGANYSTKESLDIDLDILKEVKNRIDDARKPKVLYIGIALCDDHKQIDSFTNYYNSLGFDVNVLYSYKKELEEEILLKSIFDNDIIYFGGGLTYRLVSFAKKYSLQKHLKYAFENGKIIVGVSAGAIMLFKYGYGDKDAFVDNLTSINHKITEGINLFKAIFCPHYQNSGGISFHDEIKKFNHNGFAVENGAALKIEKNGFSIVKSNTSNVFMFDYENNHRLIHLKKDTIYSINLLK